MKVKFAAAWGTVAAGARYQKRMLWEAEPGLVNRFEDWLGIRDVQPSQGPECVGDGGEFKILWDAWRPHAACVVSDFVGNFQHHG